MHRVTLNPVTVPPSSHTTYVVKSGDTLRTIAMAFLHNPLEAYGLATRNGLRPDSDLSPGQELIIK